MPEWGQLPIPKKLLQQGVRDMVRISDARMSGTSYGACVLHVAPESFVGGPLALVQDGDLIELDVPGAQAEPAGQRRGARARGAPHGSRPRRATSAATARCTRSTSRRPNEGCDFDFLGSTARRRRIRRSTDPIFPEGHRAQAAGTPVRSRANQSHPHMRAEHMNWKNGFRQAGVPAALAAALLFGAGTPLAKWLLDGVSPWLLAGLLYLGSGLGLTLYRRLIHAPAVRLPRNELSWFAGAILAGGIVGPVLLMIGLTGMPASGASLLLNAEGVFTALLAWFAFKENFDRRIALGMGAIVAGAAVLSWPGEARFAGLWPTLAVLGACFAWGIDNNLTRKISLTDATWIASVKGLVSGSVNLILAVVLGCLHAGTAECGRCIAGGLAGLWRESRPCS